MKIKHLVVAFFSLGLVCASCGKKKKGDHKEHTEQGTDVPAESYDDHEHGHGHDHGAHEGHEH